MDKWGSDPWGEEWSIETTADEPTMTLIDNSAATREEALAFPATDVIVGASRLEKALVNHFKQRDPSFWDAAIRPQSVSREAVAMWSAHAKRVRAAGSRTKHDWLPAGKATDRNAQPGAWMGLPLLGGGFGAAILIDRPSPHLRLFSDTVVMAMRRKWDRWPNIDEVQLLGPKDGAFVAQASLICVRDGRWRVLGSHPNFKKAEWPWPIPWFRDLDDLAKSVVSVSVGPNEQVKVRLAPSLLARDPHAGRRCNGSSSYGHFESAVPRILNGTEPGLNDDNENDYHIGIVTPERLAAWKAINGVIEKATAGKQS